MKTRTWFPALIAGLAHAALMIAAFPPYNLWFTALLALVPLVLLVRRESGRPGRDVLALMLGVAPMWLLWCWWMLDVTAPGFPFFILLQCSWVGLFYWVTRRVLRRFPRLPVLAVMPLVWVAVEFFRGEIFLSGYAFGLLGYPVIQQELAGPATWLGAYFVSFLVALMSTAVGELLFKGRRLPAGITIAAAALVWAGGVVDAGKYEPQASDPVVRPGIVQTNLPQNNKLSWGIERSLQDWDRFAGLTVALANSDPKPDFILWPETMMPGETLESQAMQALRDAGVGFRLPNGAMLPSEFFYQELQALQTAVTVPMLVGEDALVDLRVDKLAGGRISVEWGARYNSAYLVMGGQVQPVRFDKVRLTPFGETMPLINRWPWLQNQLLSFGARGMKFDLAAGTSLTVFEVPGAATGNTARIVTPICFETTVSALCRDLVFEKGQRRANLIANLTNDGWFSHSDLARAQHLQIAQWRCVELATPMARAANTGISCLIDAQGRVTALGVEGSRQRAQVDGILKGEVALGTRTTLFARVGNVFPWTVFVVTTLALAGTYVRRKQPGIADAPRAEN
jgi:apolipoprotein N-acyltransferase